MSALSCADLSATRAASMRERASDWMRVFIWSACSSRARTSRVASASASTWLGLRVEG